MIDSVPTLPGSLVAAQAAKRAGVLLATVVVALALMLWYAGVANAATSQTFTIASGSPTALVSNLNAGDKIDIVATLNTTDVNENGEGEPLVLQSSGGFSATIPSYAQPTALSFTATANGESLSGFIVGYDGDEDATVTVTVNSTDKKRLTQAQKDALAKASADLNIWAAGGATVTAICAVLPPPADLCVAFFGPFSGVTWLGSALLGRLAADPSDPNFTVIAQPIPPAVPPLPNLAGITQAERDAYTALLGNLVNVIAYADAAQISINRATGAADAGDSVWEAKQAAAAAAYLAHLGSLLQAEPALLTAFADALAAGGVVQPISSGDVFNFELNVLFFGLPTFLADTLNTLGADSDALAQIRQLAIVQNIDLVAGTYPQALTNAAMLDDLRDAGAALHGDTTPPQIDTTASPTSLWPPNGKLVPVTVSGTMTDDGSGVDPATASFSVLDEYGAVQPAGPITVAADGSFSFTVRLEARRAGGDRDGRHYTITVQAADTAGNVGTTQLDVVVPHDQR